MIKKIILFGNLIGSLFASTSMPENATEEEVVLKNMTGRDDIMNLDHVFGGDQRGDFNKATTGKGKDKDRKKKPKKKKESSSSSSSSDEEQQRRSRRDNRSAPRPVISNPGQNEPVIRQQEVAVGGAAGGNRHVRHSSREDVNVRTGDDGVITVDGPIRRKPLIFPN